MSLTSVFTFQDLSPEILYEILKLRQDVFIIEQNCAYADIDNMDQNASHLLLFHNQLLVACCRILTKHPDYPHPAIGRIVVHPDRRGEGYGKIIITEALELLTTKGYPHAVIEAQEHLEQYYNSFGFYKTSEPYDLDEIPHIQMEIDLA